MNLQLRKQTYFVGFMMIISLIILSISSCNKEKEEEVKTIEAELNDNYYIKYIISASYPRIFSDWTVSTPDGNYSKTGYQTRSWTQTYGPVKKGFKCYVRVNNGMSTKEIHVAKNQEPFALKVTTENSSASYIID